MLHLTSCLEERKAVLETREMELGDARRLIQKLFSILSEWGGSVSRNFDPTLMTVQSVEASGDNDSNEVAELLEIAANIQQQQQQQQQQHGASANFISAQR